MQKTIYFYANNNDYKTFERFLHKEKVKIIDTAPRTSKGIKIIENIYSSKISEVVLLNTNIISIKEYESSYTKIGDYYHYASIGVGLIQLLKSEAKFKKLEYGRLSATFDDDNTKNWVNEIFKWIRKQGEKVYRTRENLRFISDYPEKNFYCLPNAGEEFRGVNGNFLKIIEGVFAIYEPEKVKRR